MFFFGDLPKAAMMGERRGVTIKRSDHRYFENDQIGLLGTERFDINVHDFGDNTNAGPLVAGRALTLESPVTRPTGLPRRSGAL
jgi:hypothetical protein